MAVLQMKAVMILAMLAGHEAMRIQNAAESVAAVRRSKAGAAGTPEENYQALNHECEWSTYNMGCTGISYGAGCAWRRMSLDYPPPSSQSCRHTDEYMLENNGVANFKMTVGVFAAKSVKYNDNCKGATMFNRKCARRQQQMMRAMKFIAKAETNKDVMDGMSTEDRAQQKELFDTSLSNLADTVGEDGPMIMELASKMKADPATKKDPKAAVMKIVDLIAEMTFGSEEEKTEARNKIRTLQASEPLSEEENREADEANVKMAQQLNSEKTDVSTVLDSVDTIAPDHLNDDGTIGSLLELANTNSSMSMLQVRSKAWAANAIAFVLLAAVVAIVVILAVVEVIAAIVTWAVVAILGCGAYAAGHDAAVAKQEKNPVAKLGFTGFATCFLKVFAFPFVLVGTAAVATYRYFFGTTEKKEDKKNKDGSGLLQIAAGNYTLDSDKVYQGLVASANRRTVGHSHGQ